MRTILLLLALWSGASLTAMRRWVQDRAVDRRDRQLRALIGGAVVPRSGVVMLPMPRTAPDDQRAATTNSANDAACRPVAASRTR